jgi:phosphomannomutase
MKKCFLFDVDGTLTPPRKPINKTFLIFWEDWVKKTQKKGDKVFLVTGSDLPKLTEQINGKTLDKCSGYFCCMGNEYYSKRKLVYQTYNSYLEKGGRIEEWLNTQLKKNKYSKKFPPHIEFRTGMINFSFVGRGCSTEQRRIYNEWDKENKQRQKTSDLFNETFKKEGFESFVGGEISIDIQAVNFDKRQSLSYLREQYGYLDFIFFGDKCNQSGNDYSIFKECKQANRWHVKDWKNTFEILAEYYS